MVETKVTTQPENVVQRNIALLGELTRYLLQQPHILDALPEDFELVILPDDDPEMRLYNLELLDKYGDENKPVVFAQIKSDPEARSKTRPHLYVPLAA
jgi:hypothetical protein